MTQSQATGPRASRTDPLWLTPETFGPAELDEVARVVDRDCLPHRPS